MHDVGQSLKVNFPTGNRNAGSTDWRTAAEIFASDHDFTFHKAEESLCSFQSPYDPSSITVHIFPFCSQRTVYTLDQCSTVWSAADLTSGRGKGKVFPVTRNLKNKTKQKTEKRQHISGGHSRYERRILWMEPFGSSLQITTYKRGLVLLVYTQTQIHRAMIIVHPWGVQGPEKLVFISTHPKNHLYKNINSLCLVLDGKSTYEK